MEIKIWWIWAIFPFKKYLCIGWNYIFQVEIWIKFSNWRNVGCDHNVPSQTMPRPHPTFHNEAKCTCHFTTFGPTKQKILNFKWFWFMEINFFKFKRFFPVMKISLWRSYKESEVKHTSIRNSIGMGGRCLMYLGQWCRGNEPRPYEATSHCGFPLQIM